MAQIQTVCQAIDRICECLDGVKNEPSTPPSEVHPGRPITPSTTSTYSDEKNALPNHNKAFCAIRPPGHHCGEDTPSGYVLFVFYTNTILTSQRFCYVNNVVVGALHGKLSQQKTHHLCLKDSSQRTWSMMWIGRSLSISIYITVCRVPSPSYQWSCPMTELIR